MIPSKVRKINYEKLKNRKFQFKLPSSCQQIQHRHPYRYPIFYLVENNRMRRIGHVRCQLDTAIYGAGVHDNYLFSNALQQFSVDAKELRVLPNRRKKLGFLSLHLNPKDICHVAPFQSFPHIMRHPYAQSRNVLRNQGRRPTNDDFCTEFL